MTDEQCRSCGRELPYVDEDDPSGEPQFGTNILDELYCQSCYDRIAGLLVALSEPGSYDDLAVIPLKSPEDVEKVEAAIDAMTQGGSDGSPSCKEG